MTALKSSTIIADLFSDFDVTLIEDELVARGLSGAEALRLTTSGTKTFREFAQSKQWDIATLYEAIAARAERKALAKKAACNQCGHQKLLIHACPMEGEPARRDK
jgi:hypothetical protein